MDIVYTYSHLGGEEILLVRHPKLYKEIMSTIAEIENPGKSKVSKERTMNGEQLYSPIEINKLFKESFNKMGWAELKDSYDIQIPDYPHVVKGAFKQCDFHKDPVLIEVQF